MVRGCIVRIKLEGSLELLLSADPVPIKQVQQLSQRVVCLCELIIQSKRLLHGLPSKARIVGQLIDVREASVRARIVWILLDRLLKVPLCFFATISFVKEKATFQIVFVGFRINRPCVLQDSLFVRSQFDPDLVGDGAGNLFLQRQSVAKISVIACSPKMFVGRCLYQLCGNSNLVTERNTVPSTMASTFNSRATEAKPCARLCRASPKCGRSPAKRRSEPDP